MNSNSPENWQELFEQLPVDSQHDESHARHLKQQAMQAYDSSTKIRSWKTRSYDQLSKLGHYLMTNKTPRWAAALIAIVVATWFLASTSNRPAFAMNKLFETILNARTVRYTMTAQTEGDEDGFLMEAKMFYAEPGKMRMELDDTIMVDDYELNKRLVFSPTTKTATLTNSLNIPVEKKGQLEEGFTRLRQQILEAQRNSDESIDLLGKKEIDGQTLIGFRIQTKRSPMTVWVDPETYHPCIVEVKQKPAKPSEQSIVMTFSDFEFNVELDDSLFSLEVPEGYQVK